MTALDELTEPAKDDDAVAGVAARLVAAPSSTAQAAAVLRAAADAGLAVAFRGGGTKLDWGAPPRELDLIVDTRRLTGVVEHAAGDLIVVVRAGTPVADLREHLTPAGQQLALDTAEVGATVGGTVAVSTSGPRRQLYGTARDLVIGMTVVRADGTVAHSGGKVVKNVAGYDLAKLFTGAYGTLGLITRCAFRLHPLPGAEAVVRAAPPDLAAALAAIHAAQVVPSAVELDAESGEVAVLVEGTPAGVRDRVATLTRILGDDAGRPHWWGTYPWEPGGTGLKLTAALSRVPALVARAATRARVRGSAGTGVLYAGLPADTPPDEAADAVTELRAAAGEAGGHAVVLTAPAGVRARVDMWGPVDGLALMRRVKQQFDPDARLAPGRFVGGI
ncbi:FAD-binding oxidoreductase [Krasilnikovia sp. MM14-A1004]|uniref:FAD-binding oxidoreductase n=1 Tax=Krasilnikovia sp. MM14-A1004 TaxID=3373541 RepID=UPI00399D1635